MRFVIVRHAETHSNVARQFQGSGKGAGAALTLKGREQARALGAHLATRRLGVDAIYSSPSTRTFETAKMLGEILKVPITICDELREIDCGDWEGQASELIKETYPDLWELWQKKPLELCFPNGESLCDVQARVAPLLSNLIAELKPQTKLLVSHSATISVMLAYLHNWSLEEAWGDGRGYHINTAFSILDFDGKSGKLAASEIALDTHLDMA